MYPQINIPKLVCKILYLLLFSLSTNGFAQYSDSLNMGMLDTIQLSEVTISAKVDVSVKSDTISYTVDSFNNNPSANTEDVLKRLPGMYVSQNGEVTMNGKKVTRIYINGREYFTPDMKMVTQNLPAEVLQKIQVYDWQNNESVATGFKHRNGEKVLNLVFKEKYNAGLISKIKVGAGENERYECGGLINYFGPRGEQVNLIGDVNNTNSGSNSLYNSGIRASQKYNTNISKEINDKTTVSIGYDYNRVRASLIEESYTKTFLADGSELNKKSNTDDVNETTNQRVVINGVLKEKFMDVRTSVTIAYAELDNKGQLSDAVSTLQGGAGDFNRHSVVHSRTVNSSIGIQNEFNKHFSKKGRALSVKMNYGSNLSESTKDNAVVNNTTTANTYKNTALNKYTNNNIQFELRYSEPVGKSGLIFVTYKNSLQAGKGNATVYVDSNGTLANNESNLVIDYNQSRATTNRYNYTPVGLSYQLSKKYLTVGCGLEAQPYKRKNEITPGMPVESGVNYAPLLYTRYILNRHSNVDVNYASSITLPTVYQLQPTPDYTDSLNIYRGNPELKPETRNDISISYNNINLRTNASSWLNININWAKNMIADNTDNYVNRKITQPINTNGNYNIDIAGSYALSIIPKIFMINFVTQANMTTKTTVTNSMIQKNSYYTISPGLRLSYYSNKIFTGDMMYYFSHSQTNQSLAGGALQTHNLTNSGTFLLPIKLNLGYQFTYVSNKGIYKSSQEDFLLANLSADMLITKVPGLTVGLKAFNVFNSYPNNVRLIRDNYIEEKTSNSLGRFVICSLSYKFNYFPAKEK